MAIGVEHQEAAKSLYTFIEYIYLAFTDEQYSRIKKSHEKFEQFKNVF